MNTTGMLRPSGKTLLLLAVLFELLLVSRFSNIAGPYFSPVLLLGVGLLVPWLYLRIRQQKEQDPAPVAPAGQSPWYLLSLVLFGVLSILLFMKLRSTFASIPVREGDSSASDIIPQIITLCRRFVQGEAPYRNIPFPGYVLYPTYLPLQWMPYCIAEWLHFDYRWVPAGVLWLSSAYYFFNNSSKEKTRSPLTSAAALWPLIVWFSLVQNDSYLFGITVESLAAGYYLFLGERIKKQNAAMLGIALALCLFSRYSVVLWVPLCLLALLLKRSWKPVWTVTGVLLLVFICVYWLPFLRNDPDIFLKGYRYHSGAALGEWQHVDDSGRPVHLYNGLGMASWTYRVFGNWALHRRLEFHQRLHLVISLLTVAALAIWYLRRRSRVTLDTFLLFSLKVYLTVFYCFIQIPYKYLFLVPLIVSSCLMTHAFGRREAGSDQPGP